MTYFIKSGLKITLGDKKTRCQIRDITLTSFVEGNVFLLFTVPDVSKKNVMTSTAMVCPPQHLQMRAVPSFQTSEKHTVKDTVAQL